MYRTPKALALSALLLSLTVPPSWALQASGDDAELPALAAAVATLQVEGRDRPIGASRTALGPLFDLATIVDVLGSELVIGPLGQSHSVALGDAVAILGPGSSAITIDQKIIRLSQAPRMSLGGLHVPLDALEELFSVNLGWEFRWDPQERRLAVERRQLRTLPLTLDLVHLQGVSTLVLQLPVKPRYQVSQQGEVVQVDIIGDHLELAENTALPDDPLVRRVRVAPTGVSIRLAPDAIAEDYLLHDPYRLVFDIYRREAPATEKQVRFRGPVRRRGIHTIVLDPGHGGADGGATGSGGGVEKDLNLQIARSLKRRLESRLGVRVLLTRDGDAELALEMRTALANQYKADLFVSLHMNSFSNSNARGAETYFLSMQASDQRAAEAAARENQQGSREQNLSYDLQLILWDLAQSQHLAESQRLANLIQSELNLALDLKDRGVKQAPFTVLMGASMPAVLVELGFLSNPKEERALMTAEHRSALVASLAGAISRFKTQMENTGTEAASGAVP